MNCAFCGSPATCHCDEPAAKKRQPVPAAQIAGFDTITIRPKSRRLWKVLRTDPFHADPFGAFRVLDVECRIQRRILVRPPAAILTVIRIEPCRTPCCEIHARDLDGRRLCPEHW